MHRCIVATWYILSSLMTQGRGCSGGVAGFRSPLPCYEVRPTWACIILSFCHIVIGMILQGQPLSLHCNPGRYVGGTNGHWDEEYSWHKLQTTHEQCKDKRTLKLIDTWGLLNNIIKCPQTARSKHWHKGLDQTMLTQWVWPQVTGSYTM